ncbi:hypothetical protein, conserved [Plasmodium gonderi]|uniref:V-SNARE coiled-coil homology domain-containing protein n=1 Tax=Plasmodium gonderi TaxID=77519 RepID=A0A1Y1JAU6_PLAGO|nr:hypothetical protein, conserved [Plasmodium gonderi]GAW79639.1 hypothetical protein, conserved [Plasmodium gonderi]
MYMLSEDEITYTNSLYSEQVGTDENQNGKEKHNHYKRNKISSYSFSNDERDNENESQNGYRNERKNRYRNGYQSDYHSDYQSDYQNDYPKEYQNEYSNELQNEFELFKYVCIASIEDAEILLKCSFLSDDLDTSANCTIKKILMASKKKLNYCNKKILNWENKIIYFTICTEKKLAFFLIGLHMKTCFKNYIFEFLRKLEIYAKSNLFYNQNYKSQNINPSKIHTIQSFMKNTIKSINKCCRDEKIIAVKQKLHRINSVMNNHIDNLYQSRGNIRALQYKTQNMSKNTLNFVQNSKRLKRAMFFKYWKTYVCLAFFAIIGFKVYRSI